MVTIATQIPFLHHFRCLMLLGLTNGQTVALAGLAKSHEGLTSVRVY